MATQDRPDRGRGRGRERGVDVDHPSGMVDKKLHFENADRALKFAKWLVNWNPRIRMHEKDKQRLAIYAADVKKRKEVR